MMLKPTFPSPYLTSVDADNPVVMSCVVNERNYIEGYDLCIERKDEVSANVTKTHVIGVYNRDDGLMHKYWYQTGANLDNTTTNTIGFFSDSMECLDSSSYKGYVPDATVDETLLPIQEKTKTTLKIKIPSVSRTKKYTISGLLSWRYSEKNGWGWNINVPSISADVFNYLRVGDKLLYTADSSYTEKSLKILDIDIIGYNLFVEFIGIPPSFDVKPRVQKVSTQSYYSDCYRSMPIYKNGIPIQYSYTQSTGSLPTDEWLYFDGLYSGLNFKFVSENSFDDRCKYKYVYENDIACVWFVDSAIYFDTVQFDSSNYSTYSDKGYIVCLQTNSGELIYRLYPQTKNHSSWTRVCDNSNWNSGECCITIYNNGNIFSWYASSLSADKTYCTLKCDKSAPSDMGTSAWKRYCYYPMTKVDKTWLDTKEISNASSLFNDQEYKWSIRLFNKNAIVYSGKCKYEGSAASSSSKPTRHRFSIPGTVLHPNTLNYVDGYRMIIRNNDYPYDKESDTLLYIRYSDIDFTPSTNAEYNFIIINTNDDYIVDSPEYYFRTCESPYISLGSADEFAYTTPYSKTIIGNYIFGKTNPINWWKIAIKDSNGNIVEETGKCSARAIKYTGTKPLLYGDYSAELTCGFINGSTSTAPAVSFSSSICETYSYQHYLTVSSGNGYFKIDLNQCDSWYNWQARPDGYVVLRKNEEDDTIVYLGYYSDMEIHDFSVRNNSRYTYIAYPVEYNTRTQIYTPATVGFKTKTPVSLSWNGWILYDLIPADEENSYTVDKDNIWYFNVGIKNGTFTPKYNKVFEYGFGKYPKGYTGKSNALTGSFSCNIGNVSCSNSEYIGDDIYALKRWQDFCANGRMKLLKSPKGHVIPCGIADTSYDVNNSPSQETQISFNYTQLEDENKISVYEVE